VCLPAHLDKANLKKIDEKPQCIARLVVFIVVSAVTVQYEGYCLNYFTVMKREKEGEMNSNRADK
jgi:hypothetical protein